MLFVVFLSYTVHHLHLHTVCELLAKVRHKWWTIGTKLHIPYQKLREFEVESDPFEAIINYWVKGNIPDVPVTWTSIIAVLESSAVDERRLAQVISEKYTSPQSSMYIEFEMVLVLTT